MAIKLTQTNTTDTVGTFVTNMNDHVDVTSALIGRITGGTGSATVISNPGSNLAAATQSVSIGGNTNDVQSGANGSGIFVGTTNTILTGGIASVLLGGILNQISGSSQASAIIGGGFNSLRTANASVILGGSNIVGTKDNTAYVQNLCFTATGGMKYQTGATPTHFGQVTMTTGAATVTTSAVRANSLIFFNYGIISSGTVGVLSVNSITSGVGFDIESSEATNGVVYWHIVNPE